MSPSSRCGRSSLLGIILAGATCALCLCRTGFAQNEATEAAPGDREDYLRAVVMNFWKHERWRTSRLIQSYLGSEMSDQGRATITDSSLERAVGDEWADKPGIYRIGGSFDVVFFYVRHRPGVRRELRREVLRALADIFADMAVLCDDPLKKRPEHKIVVGKDKASLMACEGRVRLRAVWGDPPFGEHVGARKLAVEFSTVMEPRVSRTKEWQEGKLLRGVRHFAGLDGRLIKALNGNYDAVPGLSAADPDERIRTALCLWEAAWMSGRLKPKYAPALLEAIRREKDESVLPFLFLPLELAVDEDVAEKLLALVEAGEEGIAGLGAATLLRVISAELWKWYHEREVELVPAARRAIRQAAMEALSAARLRERRGGASMLCRRGVDGDDEALRAIVKAVREEPFPDCVCMLLAPLASSQGERAFEALVSLLGDDRPEVWGNSGQYIAFKKAWEERWRARREKLTGKDRLRASFAMGLEPGYKEELETAPKEAFGFLASLLNLETCDRAGGVFFQACRHLVEHGDRQAAPLFIRVLGELSAAGMLRHHRYAAAQALLGVNRLTGRNYGDLEEALGSPKWHKAAEGLDWDAVFKELRRDFPSEER